MHVPFCRAKCPYCDFVSLGVGRVPDAAARAYARRLAEEARHHRSAIGAPLHARTLYVGGGTPTVLPAGVLAEALAGVAAVFESFAPDEATVEANPESLSDEKVEELKAAGFTRVSVGVQSLDEDELRFLGRVHDAAAARAAVGRARGAGFSVSLDLIYGIPGQTPERFARTLKEAVALGPDSVSCYALTLSEEAPLARFVRERGLPLPDADATYELYATACAVLGGAGYRHYEVSNWARPGAECRHNLRYWRREPYLGLGPGAASMVGSTRFANRLGVEAYLAGGAFEYEVDEIAEEGAALEELYLGLRTADGLRADRAEAAAARFWPGFAEALAANVARGYLTVEGGAIRATEAGMFVLDAIVVDLTGSG